MIRTLHSSSALIALGSIAVVFAVVFGGPLVLAVLGYVGLTVLRVRSRKLAMA